MQLLAAHGERRDSLAPPGDAELIESGGISGSPPVPELYSGHSRRLTNPSS